jgi:hypothetical protein
MTQEHVLQLQRMAIQIVKSDIKREQAIKEVVAKRGLSYAALRQLRNAA